MVAFFVATGAFLSDKDFVDFLLHFDEVLVLLSLLGSKWPIQEVLLHFLIVVAGRQVLELGGRADILGVPMKHMTRRTSAGTGLSLEESLLSSVFGRGLLVQGFQRQFLPGLLALTSAVTLLLRLL